MLNILFFSFSRERAKGKEREREKREREATSLLPYCRALLSVRPFSLGELSSVASNNKREETRENEEG